jgi:hypothetical protein
LTSDITDLWTTKQQFQQLKSISKNILEVNDFDLSTNTSLVSAIQDVGANCNIIIIAVYNYPELIASKIKNL